MSLSLVRDGERLVHVALYRDDKWYVYDSHTRHFHRSEAVWRDYFTEPDPLSYEPISSDRARDLITAGIGTYDRQQLRDLYARREGDLDVLVATDALADGD